METLTLGMLADLAEVFGVLAVVGSLAYVGVQIRQNAQATQISTVQVHMESYRAIVGNFVASADMADIWQRGLRDISSLRQDEVMRFFAQTGLILHFGESSLILKNQGVLTDDHWVGVSGMTADIMATPGGRAFWAHRQHWFGPEFHTWIEETILRAEGKALYPAPNATT